MSAYGVPWINTPAFDTVARNGLLFNNMYTCNAKSAPSRAAMITGPDVTGFCYTQLTDIDLEKNGIYYYDRRPKLDMQRIKTIL